LQRGSFLYKTPLGGAGDYLFASYFFIVAIVWSLLLGSMLFSVLACEDA
jgi:hypothetical protein